MVDLKVLSDFKEELSKGNLIPWFVIFVLIFLICEVIQTIKILLGG